MGSRDQLLEPERPTLEMQRRDEIAAKKAKLAELRRQREEREQRHKESGRRESILGDPSEVPCPFIPRL